MHWKSSITLFSLLSFFISTTGVVVYEHHCSKEGDFIGLYSNVDHDCVNETVEESCERERTMHCCQAQNEENNPKYDSDCCTTDVSLVKIDSDYSLNNANLDLENQSDSNIAAPRDFSLLQDIVQKESRGPPDFIQPQGKRRSIIQVYLI